jgi:hypothetical protein
MPEFPHDILINAILILDTNGERIISRYFSDPNVDTKTALSHEKQLQLEKSLTTAAGRGNFTGEMDICIVDGYVAVYNQSDDVRVFVVIDGDESETVASMVLSTIFQTLQYLFDFKISKNNILSAVDLVIFVLDECIDNGYIVELDPDEVIKRVSMKETGGDDGHGSNEHAAKFSQQDTSLTNAISRALGW